MTMAQAPVKKFPSTPSPRRVALQKRQAAIARLVSLLAKREDIGEELEAYCEHHSSERDMKALLGAVPAPYLITALERRYDLSSSNLATCLPADVFFAAMLSSLVATNILHAPRFEPAKGRAFPGDDISPPDAVHKIEAQSSRKEAPQALANVKEVFEQGLERNLGGFLSESVHSSRQRVSPLAYTSIVYNVILAWAEAAQDREDFAEILSQSLVRGRRASLAFLDLILLALWEQEGYPEDAELDESDLGEFGLTDVFEPSECLRRLQRALPVLADMTIDRLEEARDELVEALSGTHVLHS